MADAAVPQRDSPDEMLSATRRLILRVRQAQRGTWFPLLLFGVITLASLPFLVSSHHVIDCRNLSPEKACLAFSPWSYLYWPPALVLAYAVVAVFYLHRARRRGVGTRVRPYVLAGIIIAAAATGASLWLVTHPEAAGYPPAAPSPATELLYRLVSPEAGIGLALLVLARVERNRALLLFGLVYLVVTCSGWIHDHRSLPRFLLVVTAAMLIAGSIGFALAERRTGQSTS
jgi:hypothetical protein